MTDAKYNTPSEATEVDPEAERIVAEIEVTRSEMSSTIDQIGHRLQPDTIANEAKEKIREATVGRMERFVDDAGNTAQKTGNTVVETIRQNPVPAALAALGVGWLALRMRDGSSYGNGRRYRTGNGYGRGYGFARGAGFDYDNGTSSQKPRAVADKAIERAQEVGSDVQRTAQDALEQTQARVQDVQGQAQGALQDAQYQVERTWNDNPLALGALALGVGAAVALAIPETQKERELMGEPRDELVRKVSSVASQALDEAQTKAQEVAEQVTPASGLETDTETKWNGNSPTESRT